jgi:serine/threonine protein kinase
MRIMADLAGKRLGQYELIEEIGKGGMATVYRARQNSISRDVAVKILPTALMHDDTFLARFYREAEVIARLQHPHILPVYDFGEFEGMPYLVMALLTGGTLADRIVSEGPMSLDEVGRIVVQVSSALDYAHKKGIIHRDFKPSNVLLDEQGNTYLADFGLAKVAEMSVQLTGTGVMGTPTYMAPEQAEAGDLTPAVDVYALGVTVFQMLTGRLPYEASTPLGVLMAHVTQPIPDIRNMRPDLPDITQSVITSALAKSAEARYPTPSALASALAYALEVATKELRDIPSPSSNALLMTNMLGQIIFVDHHCLRLMKRSDGDVRVIIGKPLHEILGLMPKVADGLVKDVAKNGRASIPQVNLKDAHGNVVQVALAAVATFDDKKALVGMDVTLRPLAGAMGPDSKPSLQGLDSGEESLLRTYFTAQLEALQALLIQLGGKRLGNNLERIITETAQRNVWPVSMQAGEVNIDLKKTDIDIYRALMAKAVAYAVSVIGEKPVNKTMKAIDDQLDAMTLELVKQWRLR